MEKSVGGIAGAGGRRAATEVCRRCRATGQVAMVLRAGRVLHGFAGGSEPAGPALAVPPALVIEFNLQACLLRDGVCGCRNFIRINRLRRDDDDAWAAPRPLFREAAA